LRWDFQNYFRVFSAPGSAGARPIQRMAIGQRGNFFASLPAAHNRQNNQAWCYN
jgi:hypothetical protein